MEKVFMPFEIGLMHVADEDKLPPVVLSTPQIALFTFKQIPVATPLAWAFKNKIASVGEL